MKQRLAALNSQAFDKLPLRFVFLKSNSCIDTLFLGFREAARKAISSGCGFEEIDTIEVSCEKYQDYDDYDYCFMNKRTVIDSDNYVLADLKDDDVEGIIFERNMDIEYLPFKIYLQFPNLDIYKASRCSIQQISKENFEKLYRLKYIELSFNRIQKLHANTFKGLKSLERVLLSK